MSPTTMPTDPNVVVFVTQKKEGGRFHPRLCVWHKKIRLECRRPVLCPRSACRQRVIDLGSGVLEFNVEGGWTYRCCWYERERCYAGRKDLLFSPFPVLPPGFMGEWRCSLDRCHMMHINIPGSEEGGVVCREGVFGSREGKSGVRGSTPPPLPTTPYILYT